MRHDIQNVCARCVQNAIVNSANLRANKAIPTSAVAPSDWDWFGWFTWCAHLRVICMHTLGSWVHELCECRKISLQEEISQRFQPNAQFSISVKTHIHTRVHTVICSLNETLVHLSNCEHTRHQLQYVFVRIFCACFFVQIYASHVIIT